jgi:endonuclease-3
MKGMKTPVKTGKSDASKFSEILSRLSRSIPDARMELDHKNPFQLLVATVLSAQTTDRTVNAVTPALFRKFPDANALADAPVAQVEEIIRPTGFYRRKAEHVIRLADAIRTRFGGAVPDTMEDLVTLPGVGRKTASVVLAHGFGIPAVFVDTHVIRVSQRLKLTRSDDPAVIEEDLKVLMPPSGWIAGASRLLLHGRYVCLAKKPLCGTCVLEDICPSRHLFP